eukprot:6785533-Prymnesium_polylepis.1
MSGGAEAARRDGAMAAAAAEAAAGGSRLTARLLDDFGRHPVGRAAQRPALGAARPVVLQQRLGRAKVGQLSLIHISEPTRRS